jgi:hypothetical protein
MGDLSREIAAYAPIALVKQFATRHLQCAACFDVAMAGGDRNPCMARFGCSGLQLCPVAPLTQV